MTNDQTTAAANVFLRTGKLSCKDLRAVGIRKHIGSTERLEIEERASVIALEALRIIPARPEYRSEYR